MNLEPRLRAFAAVAREGSFSRAADAMFVSQPAVSKHVAALEADLGTPLVVRQRSGARLTPAGQVLADYVLRAEALLANAHRSLTSEVPGEVGRLAIAASGIPGTYILPPVLARFQDRYPGVEIAFAMSTSAGALEDVRAHRAEVGVIGGMTMPAELEAESIADDEIVLVGGPSFSGRPMRLRDIEPLSWITREEGSSTAAAVDSARWQLGLPPVRTLRLGSWEAVKLAVAEGHGVAAISRFALDVELAAGRLVILRVPGWRATRKIVIVTARDVPLTPPARRFLALLRETVHPPP